LKITTFVCIWKLQVIGSSLKLGPDIWDRVLNLVPAFCYYIAHPAHFSFIFLQSTISSKTPLLLLQELPTGNLFFDRSRANSYSPLLSHQHCNFFLFRLLIFVVKLKHTNSRVYRSYCRDENIADQCVSRMSNPEHFNRHELRYSCRVHIFRRRDNQFSWLEEIDSCWFGAAP
jgi:hypothetical protein